MRIYDFVLRRKKSLVKDIETKKVIGFELGFEAFVWSRNMARVNVDLKSHNKKIHHT